MAVNYHPDHPYVLPVDLVHAANAEAEDLRKLTEYIQGGMLTHRDLTMLELKLPAGHFLQLNSSELISFLSLSRRRTIDSKEGRPGSSDDDPLSKPVGNKILRIIVVYFDELRKVLCKGRGKSLSASTHAALATLAAWLGTITVPTIARLLDVSEPYAAKVRKGQLVPHPMHWEGLAKLVGMSSPA